MVVYNSNYWLFGRCPSSKYFRRKGVRRFGNLICSRLLVKRWKGAYSSPFRRNYSQSLYNHVNQLT